MSRMEQINELLAREVSAYISRELILKEGLITVTKVDCSPDLKNAKVFVSILPDKLFGTALSSLRKHSSSLHTYLKKTIRIRKVPRISWEIDPTEKHASVIDRLLDQIKKEEEEK